jgi:hypothetical protein
MKLNSPLPNCGLHIDILPKEELWKKGGKSNFTVEQADKYHLSQVTKATSTGISHTTVCPFSMM